MNFIQPPQNGEPPATHTTSHWIRLGLSISLLAAAAIYIGGVLRGQSAELRMALATLSASSNVIGLGLAMLTLACPALYHALAVERLSPIRGTRVHIAAAYTLSQLVRYVPGKVFGVLFEVNYLRGKVNANVLVLANTVQMSYQYAVTVLFAALVAAVLFFQSPWLWSLTILAVIVVFLAHRHAWSEHALLWIARKIPGLHGTITASVNRRHGAHAATLALALEWVFFISMWYVIDLRTAQLTPYLLLAGCYAIAATLGSLAIVMPSGLVVREGVFIWLAHTLGFDPVALIAYAAVIRIWMTGGDILIALVFGGVNRLRRANSYA